MKEDSSTKKVLGLDAGWEVIRNKWGFISDPRKISTFRLAYKDNEDGIIRSIILQFYALTKILEELKLLLEEEHVNFVGVNVGVDVQKLKRNSHHPLLQVKTINLGKFVLCRDVVSHGTV